MFRTFKKYDRNRNGVLEFREYTQCLTECPNLDLTKNEIITVAMAADLDGSGTIDFEEFMKHFPTVLNMINYQRTLEDIYYDFKAEGKFDEIQNQDLKAVGAKAKNELEKMKAQNNDKQN